MDTISYSAARRNLADTMERVCADHAPVVITRQQSESVVMMALDDYQALQETAHLLQSPENARRLLESVAELEGGGGEQHELADE
jgi:antitoxin YefM